ncbi:sensor histidine kinase [Faecalimonas sp.]
MSKRKKRKASIRNCILILVIICWVVPVICVFGFTVFSYRMEMTKRTDAMIESEMQNISSLVAGRLDDLIESCLQISYERSYEEVWKEYRNGIKPKEEFIDMITILSKQQFNLDRRFSMFAFYEVESPHVISYNEKKKHQFDEYIRSIEPEIRKIRQQDTSYVQLKVIEGRLFIVHNLYTIFDYQKFGTLVAEVDIERLFHGLEIGNEENVALVIDQKMNLVQVHGKVGEKSQKYVIDKLFDRYRKSRKENLFLVKDLNYNAYMNMKEYNFYNMGVLFLVNSEEVYSGLYEFYRVISIIFTAILPVTVGIFYFGEKQIGNPIRELVNVSKAIEAGELGAVLEIEDMPNKEFDYLVSSFNNMSKKVKYLFDCVYDEKMARKDAKILALQTQINPHFINNTLEMMNWQARMTGDFAVSEMIEALGTVMDYRMNRENQKLTTLKEELKCSEAYLFITKKRFGERLIFEKEIDESILDTMVPRLVLQPILENAVIHGIERVKRGIIKICIYRKGNEVVLEVINTSGRVSKEEKDRIRRILYDIPEDIQGIGKHTSLGIRNVNERIKLIYGKEYGLDIEIKEEHISFKMLIPYKWKPKDEEEKKHQVEIELKEKREQIWEEK